jgi:hypothetical protein
MRPTHTRNWNMARNSGNVKKCEINTVGPGLK